MVRVGVVGTSLWADSMYLPALKNHPGAEVVAVCGRNPERARAFAARWGVPRYFTDYRQMLDSGLDAVVVATTNDTHHPITMAALGRGLHALCEKPLALNVAQAREMANKAAAAGVKNMVPFTYRYMPTNRYLKQLIDDGYIGRPHHLNMRYYADYGRESKYQWVFDSDIAGGGVIADLGPHWFHLARWFYGEIVGLTCYLATIVERPDMPDGKYYPRADDAAVITVKFASGAFGVLTVSTVAWEGNNFGQTHHIDLHGSEGTLYSLVDWSRVQEVRGLKAGDRGDPKLLTVPEAIWDGVRQDTVHNTYRDVFRQRDNMAREFITAIEQDKPVYPDFAEGARVQQLVDASITSAKAGSCWVDVAP